MTKLSTDYSSKPRTANFTLKWWIFHYWETVHDVPSSKISLRYTPSAVGRIKCWLYFSHIHLKETDFTTSPQRTLLWKLKHESDSILCERTPEVARQRNVFVCTSLFDPFWTPYWHEQKQHLTKHYGRQDTQNSQYLQSLWLHTHFE